MRLDEPGWWYGTGADERPGLTAHVRTPVLRALSRLYGRIVEQRFHRRQPYRSRYPVICVGNFVAGGTGKTPLALLIARLIIAQGGNPVFLTRGYGGRERGPVWVSEGANAAWRFGDEPLLLARVAPTLVARDRKAGVHMIEDSGRDVAAVIMDDGLQNPALVKDLSIAVIDGVRGLGNGEVIPAGPLRAPMAFQLGLVDAIAVREPQADPGDRRARRRQASSAICAAAFTARCWRCTPLPIATRPGSPGRRSSPLPGLPIRRAFSRLSKASARASSPTLPFPTITC